jgi:hypothetical protein
MKDARGRAADETTDVGKIGTDELGDVGVGRMTPRACQTVQLARVCRQELDGQSRGLAAQESSDVASAMRRQAVSQQDRLATVHVAFQGLLELTDHCDADRKVVPSSGNARPPPS